MKPILLNFISKRALIVFACVAMFTPTISAQNGNLTVKTNMRVLYHDGPVMHGQVNAYLIWYGTWSLNKPGNDSYTQQIVRDFITGIGGSSYFTINNGYSDSNGLAPSGALIYSGETSNSFWYGSDLNPLAMQGVVTDAVTTGSLPADPNGIYLILASSDMASTTTGLCAPNAPPYHGSFTWNGVTLKYGFVGNPLRCPSVGAPQLAWPGPTPNDDFAGDGIVNRMAWVLSTIVTNPTGAGWFDRYGFENSTKCQGLFGPTFQSPNGSSANVFLGSRVYLLQQNWVNARKAYCALSSPTP